MPARLSRRERRCLATEVKRGEKYLEKLEAPTRTEMEEDEVAMPQTILRSMERAVDRMSRISRVDLPPGVNCPRPAPRGPPPLPRPLGPGDQPRGAAVARP